MGLKTLTTEAKCDFPGCDTVEVYKFCEQTKGWSQMMFNHEYYLLCGKCNQRMKNYLLNGIDRLTEFEDKVSVLLVSLGDVNGNSLNLPLERQVHAKQALESLSSLMKDTITLVFVGKEIERKELKVSVNLKLNNILDEYFPDCSGCRWVNEVGQPYNLYTPISELDLVDGSIITMCRVYERS